MDFRAWGASFNPGNHKNQLQPYFMQCVCIPFGFIWLWDENARAILWENSRKPQLGWLALLGGKHWIGGTHSAPCEEPINRRPSPIKLHHLHRITHSDAKTGMQSKNIGTTNELMAESDIQFSYRKRCNVPAARKKGERNKNPSSRYATNFNWFRFESGIYVLLMGPFGCDQPADRSPAGSYGLWR